MKWLVLLLLALLGSRAGLVYTEGSVKSALTLVFFIVLGVSFPGLASGSLDNA